jgi:hypothetical protein
MPVLHRYYVAWALNLLAFAGFLLSKALVLGAVAVAMLVYAYWVRCPRCGHRIVKNRRRWIDLFPAKTCFSCVHDLTKP